MKTIPTLLVLMASAIGLLAQAPPARRAAPVAAAPVAAETNQEALVRLLLDRAYAEAGKTNATTRALPTLLNAVTNAGRPVTPPTAVTFGAPPAPTPAPATPTPAAAAPGLPVIDPARPAAPTAPPATLAATPAASTNAAARTNRPARVMPAFPAFPQPGAANPAAAAAPGPATPAAAVATPVFPAVPNPNNAQPPNVNAAVAPGVANPADANAAAGAKPANPEDEVFPPGLIKFSEADLSQVLEIYQELTGRTVLKPASLPAAKISIRSQTQLTRAEAVQALDSILSMNGIAMVPQGDKFVKAVPEGTAFNTGKKFDDLPWELLPESGTIVTYVVQLTNAAPQEVATVLAQFAKLPGNSILAVPSTSMLVLRDYAENVKRMMEMIQRLDVVPVQEFVDVVIPIKYALADDIAQVLSSLTAGGGSPTTVGNQPTRTGISAGGSGFGAGGNRAGGVGGLGGIGGNQGYNQGYQNNALGAQGAGGLGGGGLGGGASGRSSFAQRLNQIVNRAAGAGGAGGDIFVLGQTKIIADARTNSLLIFASKADLGTISNIIEKLDVVLAQVLIEAIILEVKVGNTLNYGFSYLQHGSTALGNGSGVGALKTVPFLNFDSFQSIATNGLGGLPSGFSYTASFMNFEATVQALAGDSRVNIISRPKIQTSHAVEANIFVGQTRPYVTGTYQSFGGGPQTQFQQQQIGLTLSVLPLINSEGLVVMDIHVKVQNIGESIPIDANFSVPETIDRETAAKVAVRDRETIMLGGFISRNLNKTKSGIPILKDIPWLGALFRSTTEDQSRTELITLIRPTVLPSPKDAAVFASEERRRLPAVRQAERDFDDDTRRRQKAEDKATEKENRKLYKEEGFKP